MRKLLIATLTGFMVSLTAVAAAGAPAAPRAGALAAPRAAVQGTAETLAVAPTQPDTHEGPGSCVRVGTKGAGGRTAFLCAFHAPPEGQDCHTYFKVRRIVGGYNCRPERGRGLAIPTSVAVPTAADISGGCGPLGSSGYKLCVLQTRPKDGTCKVVIKTPRVASLWRCQAPPEVAGRIA
jgi:hypothetical protein